MKLKRTQPVCRVCGIELPDKSKPLCSFHKQKNVIDRNYGSAKHQ